MSYFPLPWLHKIISQRYAKNPWFEGNEKRSRMIFKCFLNGGVSKKTAFSLLFPKQSVIFALPNAFSLQSVGNAGGLIYEKDVFERLSLCPVAPGVRRIFSLSFNNSCNPPHRDFRICIPNNRISPAFFLSIRKRQGLVCEWRLLPFAGQKLCGVERAADGGFLIQHVV